MRNLELYSKSKQKTFKRVLENYALTEKPLKEKVNVLMTTAIEFKKQYIQTSDKIKTEIFENAGKDIVLNEKMFKTFLDLADKITEGKDVDKKISKIIEKNLEAKYVSKSTKAFIDGYVYNSDPRKEFKMPDFDDVIDGEEQIKDLSVDASNLVVSLQEGVLERTKMTSIKSLLNDVVFTLSVLISNDNEEIKPSAINKIVDMEVTKDGFPDKEKKPKMYSLIENLNTTTRLYNKLGLDSFNEKLSNFGLLVKEEKEFVATTKWTEGMVEISEGNYQEF